MVVAQEKAFTAVYRGALQRRRRGRRRRSTFLAVDGQSQAGRYRQQLRRRLTISSESLFTGLNQETDLFAAAAAAAAAFAEAVVLVAAHASNAGLAPVRRRHLHARVQAPVHVHVPTKRKEARGGAQQKHHLMKRGMEGARHRNTEGYGVTGVTAVKRCTSYHLERHLFRARR